MSHKQIEAALARVFHEQGQRIVFWNDPEKEFQSILQFIMIEGVTTLRLDQEAALETKILLERSEPERKFLLYSPTEEPEFESDWLLDVRLYSTSFRADRASIVLQELGLANQHLRTHLAERRKFFDAKERLQKLKALVAAEDVAADLDRKMIAVVVKSDHPELFNLVHTIFHAWADPGTEIDLDTPPEVWTQLEKFDLDRAFWRMVQGAFGYTEEDPSLKNFLLRLCLTDFAHSLKGDVASSLKPLLLPQTGWANAVVCLAQWRDSNSKAISYDRLSAIAGNALKIEDHLPSYELEQLLDVMTFQSVEKRVASSLKTRVQTTAATINAEDIRAVAARRQAGHWASTAGTTSALAPRQALHAVYDALVSAANFFALRNLHKSGFHYPDAGAMYQAYTSELFRFDQLYRLFCEAADLAEKEGWGILKPLRSDVEQAYVSWYLPSLAAAWGKFLEPEDGLLAKWRIDNIPNQHEFYARNVQPWLAEAENKRAFVIVSDAFRFEAADELASELNGKYRFQAQLSSQLGVLPSYTALGMASLLPHKTLAYKAGGSDVLVDGKSSVAGERDSILQAVGGMACKAADLMGKKKEEGREFVKDKRAVYIFHDKVDAIGDDSKTEGEAFQAVRQAIDELAALVTYVVNNLNGHHILITADHGFLFTETQPGEPDKSKLDEKPAGTLIAKKRYLLGRKLPKHASAWHGTTESTAGAGGEMEFWIPKGANRFHFVGGSRFVHGGAMPQEIVVPVLTVRHVRGKSAQDTKIKPASVQVLGSNHRITTGKHRFQLIQMDAVSERVKPVTLKVGVYEGSEAVTNIETVTFDSTSGNMDERKKWLQFILKDRQYDKKTIYHLVLRDADTGVEEQSVAVIIDRAFTDDF